MDYSKIPEISLEGLSEKDKGLIKNNPNATLDTLIEQGLSKKGEKKLTELAGAVKVVQVKATGLVPKVMSVKAAPAPAAKHVGTDAVRYQSSSTGVIKTMRRKSAEYLVKKSPEKGKIIR